MPDSTSESPTPQDPSAPLAPEDTAAQIIWLWMGVAVTLPALFFAFLSGGIGHGDYAAMKVLYPIPMLFTLVTGGHITLLSLVLMGGQFPIYGVLISMLHIRRFRIILVVTLLAHVLAAFLCFYGLLPNFS